MTLALVFTSLKTIGTSPLHSKKFSFFLSKTGITKWSSCFVLSSAKDIAYILIKRHSAFLVHIFDLLYYNGMGKAK